MGFVGWLIWLEVVVVDAAAAADADAAAGANDGLLEVVRWMLIA